MKIKTTDPDITVQSLFESINDEFGRKYKVSLKKNPVMGFEYIEVRKSAWVGVWVRRMKNKVTIMGCIPSTFNRAMLGGLITILILKGKMNRLEKEVGTHINRHDIKELEMADDVIDANVVG